MQPGLQSADCRGPSDFEIRHVIDDGDHVYGGADANMTATDRLRVVGQSSGCMDMITDGPPVRRLATMLRRSKRITSSDDRS